mmetsp:Transcript_7106/g.20052  ORF Transcript_7106/g.20052 Transcript_7106/m.20052 type:complete len:210 (-) Transcript_7106:1301-1930(-)
MDAQGHVLAGEASVADGQLYALVIVRCHEVEEEVLAQDAADSSRVEHAGVQGGAWGVEGQRGDGGAAAASKGAALDASAAHVVQAVLRRRGEHGVGAGLREPGSFAAVALRDEAGRVVDLARLKDAVIGDYGGGGVIRDAQAALEDPAVGAGAALQAVLAAGEGGGHNVAGVAVVLPGLGAGQGGAPEAVLGHAGLVVVATRVGCLDGL